MSDDELIAALAQLGREESEVDPRLEALVRGELSDEGRAALEAEARDDPELELAIAAYQPVAEDTKAELTQKLLSEVKDASAADESFGGQVLLFRRRKVLGALVAGGALAAGFALFVLKESPPFPDYMLEVSGADKTLRSTDGGNNEGTPRVAANSRVSLLLRPTKDFTHSKGRAFLVDGDKTSPLGGTVEASKTGSIRFSGTGHELFGTRRGMVTVVLVAGVQGKLPTNAEAWRSVQASGRSRSTAWVAVVQHIEVVD